MTFRLEIVDSASEKEANYTALDIDFKSSILLILFNNKGKIMQTIKTNGVPIFSWCPDVDDKALEQITTIAELPFTKHCALMSDAHAGMDMPIGGVAGIRDIIVPNFVGIDIGCGVIVIKSSLKKSDLLDIELRNKIHALVCREIPMGFSHNSQNRIKDLKSLYSEKAVSILDETNILAGKHFPVTDIKDAFFSQLGTLGGGNHYASVDYDENEDVWIMIHSGSRNIGKKIGDYFNDVASKLNQRWHSVDTHGIPFLPTDTEEGNAYLTWMNFALHFAFLNRQVMIDEMIKNITLVVSKAIFDKASMINIHHNYASLENHFGKNIWVHRKGAVLARVGTKGIIPGSMGTASFITEGLGNQKSLCSSSHGAGRTMGRKAFNVEMNTPDKIERIQKFMSGIVYSGFGKSNKKGKDLGLLDVSEAPQAYKDIFIVMENQKDLVKPIHKLMTMINWKDVGNN